MRYIIGIMVSWKGKKRLFNKNTWLCKIEKWSIGSEACPVFEKSNGVWKHKVKLQINGGCNSDGPKVAKFLGG
jgi:hypothetical protein